jgi:ribonuclease HI
MSNKHLSTYQEVLDLIANTLQDDQEAIDACQLLQKKIQDIPPGETSSTPQETNLEGDLPIPQQLIENPNAYAIFSDGACRGNPGPGSYGVIGQDGSGALILKESSLSLNTTNNIMELTAAIRGFESLIELFDECGDGQKISQAAIFLFSDSKYVVDGATKWLPGWKRKGWKKADRSEPLNLALWQRLDQLLIKLPGAELIWVKGHAGHPQNELCDQIANQILDSSGF